MGNCAVMRTVRTVRTVRRVRGCMNCMHCTTLYVTVYPYSFSPLTIPLKNTIPEYARGMVVPIVWRQCG